MVMSKEAIKLALEEYMSAFGQALEAHGIPLQEQQIKADRQAREALAKQEQGEPVLWASPNTIEFVQNHHLVGTYLSRRFIEGDYKIPL